LGFPFIISATAEASDFKSGVLLAFAKSHHKNTPNGKARQGVFDNLSFLDYFHNG